MRPKHLEGDPKVKLLRFAIGWAATSPTLCSTWMMCRLTLHE